MAKSQEEGLIQHCTGIRYRVNGSGNLRTILYSFDDELSSELDVTLMLDSTKFLPLKLANFKSQGIQIEFKVSEIDEIFSISRIIPYIRPSETGYPQ